MNRPTTSPLPAHDVPDRARTEHQVPHLRLDAQDQEFVPLESATQALLVQLLLRRPEADLLMPVVGNPLTWALTQELREIAAERLVGPYDEGRNTGGRPFVGGRLLDGPATSIGGKLLSHALFLDLQKDTRCFFLRQPPDSRLLYILPRAASATNRNRIGSAKAPACHRTAFSLRGRGRDGLLSACVPSVPGLRWSAASGAATRDSERVGAVRAIDRGFGAASGCRASAQVGHASQTQSLANLAEALATGREEAPEESTLAPILQPRLPVIGARGIPSRQHRTLGHLDFGFWIYFGFRVSDFGFAALPRQALHEPTEALQPLPRPRHPGHVQHVPLDPVVLARLPARVLAGV